MRYRLEGDSPVSYFRLYVFDRTQRVVRSFDLIAAELVNAIARARHELNAHPDGAGYELWQATRRKLGEPARNWLLARKETREDARKTA